MSEIPGFYYDAEKGRYFKVSNPADPYYAEISSNKRQQSLRISAKDRRVKGRASRRNKEKDLTQGRFQREFVAQVSKINRCQEDMKNDYSNITSLLLQRERSRFLTNQRFVHESELFSWKSRTNATQIFENILSQDSFIPEVANASIIDMAISSRICCVLIKNESTRSSMLRLYEIESTIDSLKNPSIYQSLNVSYATSNVKLVWLSAELRRVQYNFQRLELQHDWHSQNTILSYKSKDEDSIWNVSTGRDLLAIARSGGVDVFREELDTVRKLGAISSVRKSDVFSVSFPKKYENSNEILFGCRNGLVIFADLRLIGGKQTSFSKFQCPSSVYNLEYLQEDLQILTASIDGSVSFLLLNRATEVIKLFNN